MHDAAHATDRTVLDGEYRIAQIGDTQVCESFTMGGREVIDSETGMNVRLLDIHRCLEFAATRMIEAGCRLCLHTGDVFEHFSPTQNEVGYLQATLSRIAAHMPVVMIAGNHDLPKNPRHASALEFLKGRRNIHVVERPTILYQEGLAIDERPSSLWPRRGCAKLFLLPFPTKAIGSAETANVSMEELNAMVSAQLRALVEAFRAEIDPQVPNILALHLTIATESGAVTPQMLKFDPWLYPEDLRGFDHVAVGHIHDFIRLSDNAYYSGPIERYGFDEEAAKTGFVIATFQGRRPEVRFVATPSRVFRTIGPEFFNSEDWPDRVDLETVYRIKGEVTREEYERLKPLVAQFPVPLVNKLTVKRLVRVRDQEMTEDIRDEDALRRYFDRLGLTEDLAKRCMEEHFALANE